MSERLARVALGVVTGLALLVAATIDLPRASDGRFWSDGATYHAMTGSLAFDGDLEFSAADLARVRASYPGGPQGVFLKRVGVASGAPRLVYAKALVYPAAALPLARLFGVDRGLLLLNALVFSLALWLGYAELSRTSGAGAAAAGALAVLAGGVVPVYLLWETPEIFNLGLATFGLLAWRRGRWVTAAVLLGLAAYSKPTNLALALPLLLEPLLPGARPAAWAKRAVLSARRGAVVALVVAAGFGLTWLATGEMNYQGGERKTFYDRYPFDPGVTFDSAGVWMTTDHIGPLVAGRDEDAPGARVAPPRAPEELRRSFALNLGYFWIGRFGGALPYFPGVAAAALLFLLVGPRERHGSLALAALGVSWLGYVLLIPDNWYGGGGAIGNRYFLNLAPLGLLAPAAAKGRLGRGRRRRRRRAARADRRFARASLAPAGRSRDVGRLPRPAGRAHHAGGPVGVHGRLAQATSLRRSRCRRHRTATGTPPPFFLWFLDDGTFGQEESFGEEGFWLRGGESAEVVLQAPAPPSCVRLVVTSGPAGDIVTARLGSDRQRVVLSPLKTKEIVFPSPRAALGYYGTSLYMLRLGSRYGEPTPDDPRMLGSFVQVVLQDR